MKKKLDFEEEVDEAEDDLFFGCAKIVGLLLGFLAVAGAAAAAIHHLI